MMNNKPKPPSKNTPAAAEPELEVHGLRELGALSVRGYSLQLREKGGFIGDQASQTAFRKLLDRWRKRGTKKGRRGRNQGDALGGVPSADLSKRTIDRTLSKDRPGLFVF